MKKILLFAVAAVLATAAFSQVKLGVQATGSLNSASFTAEESISIKKSGQPGFGAAVAAEVPVSEMLSLRTSLGLLQKGVKVAVSGDADGGIGKMSGTVTNALYYAELPLLLAFNKEGVNSKFFIGAGPSVGVGLFGKSKAAYTITLPGAPSKTETENADAFEKEDKGGAGLKRLEVSASAVAGIQFNSGLYVQAGYLLGLTNSLPGGSDGRYKARGLQLTIGMFLKN